MQGGRPCQPAQLSLLPDQVPAPLPELAGQLPGGRGHARLSRCWRRLIARAAGRERRPAMSDRKVTASHLSRTGGHLVRRVQPQARSSTTPNPRSASTTSRGRAISSGLGQRAQITGDRRRPGPLRRLRRPGPGRVPADGRRGGRWGGPGSCSAWNAPGWPATPPTGISCWVRHEALCIRAEVEGLRRRAVAAVW